MVTSPYGRLWEEIQIRIGHDDVGRIPVRSSVGRDPDPHRVWLWW